MGKDISREALHCAAQHLKCYVEDEKYSNIAGTTVPCEDCSRLNYCDCNPLKYLQSELGKATDVLISFRVSRHDHSKDSLI